MIPGQTYIGRLPGDKRASFVRKRPSSYLRRPTFSEFLSNVFSKPRTVLIPRRSKKMSMRSWSRRAFADSDDDYEYYPRKRRGDYIRRRPGAVPWASGSGRVAHTISQTCSACGKYRSPGWQARHPLIPGEAPPPTLCKSCRDKNTSSEESDCCPPPKKRKKRKHRHYHCTESEDDYVCWRPPPRPRYTHHHHCHHGSGYTAPPSRESINVVIDNGSESSASPKSWRVIREVIREPSTTTDDEEVHVIRRIAPRKKSRSSFTIHDLFDRAPKRRRSLSSVRIVRSRTPPSPRRRYVNEVRVPSRRRSRSESRVTFTSDPDEVIVPRARASSRRQRMYYDGADSGHSEVLESVAATEPLQAALPGSSVSDGDDIQAAVPAIALHSTGEEPIQVNGEGDGPDPTSSTPSADAKEVPWLQRQHCANIIEDSPSMSNHDAVLSSCFSSHDVNDSHDNSHNNTLSERPLHFDDTKDSKAPHATCVSDSPVPTQNSGAHESTTSSTAPQKPSYLGSGTLDLPDSPSDVSASQLTGTTDDSGAVSDSSYSSLDVTAVDACTAGWL